MDSNLKQLPGFSGSSASVTVSDAAGASRDLGGHELLVYEAQEVFFPEAENVPEAQGWSLFSKDVELEEEFNKLAKRWYSAIGKQSSVEEMVLHPAYQQIIGLGTDVLPFVLKELKRTRGHWLWALSMIARDDHAKPGQSFREAVDSWLEWGGREGYL